MGGEANRSNSYRSQPRRKSTFLALLAYRLPNQTVELQSFSTAFKEIIPVSEVQAIPTPWRPEVVVVKAVQVQVLLQEGAEGVSDAQV